jgi:hypothetical protein
MEFSKPLIPKIFILASCPAFGKHNPTVSGVNSIASRLPSALGIMGEVCKLHITQTWKLSLIQ